MRKILISLSLLVIFVLLLPSCSKVIFSFSVKLDNNTNIDKSEVDIASWLSYYTWLLEHKGLKEAQTVLPDSTAVESEVWKYIHLKSNTYLPYVGDYTNQPIGYFYENCNNIMNDSAKSCTILHLPITGLTYEQVVNFCKWRTNVQGEGKVFYRLPTPDEWKGFALKSLSDDERLKGFKDSVLENKCPEFNFKYSYACNRYDLKTKLRQNFSYNKDHIGAYEIFGNASEMTSIKGVAKGGNYLLYANQCHPDSIQYYNKPEKWLGFRCIAERIRNKNGVNTNFEGSSVINKSASVVSVKKDRKYEEYADPRDGSIYPIVQIGEQTWLGANFSYKPDTGKYWTYKNMPDSVKSYGYLYNWETAKNVCPIGWHLPSKEEFETLLQNVGNGNFNTAYKELIPSGTSGFSLLEAGLHSNLGFSLNEGSAFWSCTEKNKIKAWILYTINASTTLNASYKSCGYYVRCIKDK